MIIASNNKNKILQLKEILFNYDVKSLKDCGIDIDIPETGTTFEENSYIKAKAIFDLTKDSVIADDSGLIIYEFKDWPGVETHRCFGDIPNDERNTLILNKMKGLEYDKRKCASVCVITLIDKNGKAYHFKGVQEGHISKEIRGENSFGYDDIFELDNGLNMAELTNEEKYKYSARGYAMHKLKEFVTNNKDIEL